MHEEPEASRELGADAALVNGEVVLHGKDTASVKCLGRMWTTIFTL